MNYTNSKTTHEAPQHVQEIIDILGMMAKNMGTLIRKY